MISAAQRYAFQRKILAWYPHHRRNLPWRTTTDPYAILVSEVMLQQTQVERVIPYYQNFLQHYPTIQALARARKKDLLRIWSGLGYNGRVLRLQKTAHLIVEQHQGIFPRDYEQLLCLPGVGPYTARAVLAFAFNKAAPVVDTNIRRVLLHAFRFPASTSLRTVELLAAQLIPEGKSRIWHNALMDYGALHATARKTKITSLSRQSRFEGSKRQLRGKIIRYLLQHSSSSFQELQTFFSDRRLPSIVAQLETEGFLQIIDGCVRLAP
ncbi:MAG: Fe-S cluster assembly protein HesB [Nanoarchaeota archaeon]